MNNDTIMKFHYLPVNITFSLLACCTIVAAGCGGSGVKRHNLSGKVTFQGKPVPSGRIIFEPDSSKGNGGPQGVARISNGEYSTDKFGRGAVSGPLIVRIVGLSEAADASDEGQGPGAARALFPTYTTHIELGKEDSTFDFEIPASGVAKGAATGAQ